MIRTLDAHFLFYHCRGKILLISPPTGIISSALSSTLIVNRTRYNSPIDQTHSTDASGDQKGDQKRSLGQLFDWEEEFNNRPKGGDAMTQLYLDLCMIMWGLQRSDYFVSFRKQFWVHTISFCFIIHRQLAISTAFQKKKKTLKEVRVRMYEEVNRLSESIMNRLKEMQPSDEISLLRTVVSRARNSVHKVFNLQLYDLDGVSSALW